MVKLLVNFKEHCIRYAVGWCCA